MLPDKECPSLENVHKRVKDIEDKQYEMNGDVRELSGTMRQLKESLDTTNKNFEKSNDKQDLTNERLLDLINGLKAKEEKTSVWSDFIVSGFQKGMMYLLALIGIAVIGLIIVNANRLFSNLF